MADGVLRHLPFQLGMQDEALYSLPAVATMNLPAQGAVIHLVLHGSTQWKPGRMPAPPLCQTQANFRGRNLASK